MAPPSSTRRTTDRWHPLRRAGFVFVLVLVALIALPFPFGNFGIGGPIAGWYDALWTPVVPWVASHVVGIDYTFPRWGGGETTWYYVQVGTAATLSLIAAVAWAVFDRGTANLRRADEWLRVYLRLFLAAVLFSYGWSKLLPVQFPPLGPERLSQTFGEASPNGFMWAFMGYSTGYMAFSGAGEVLAGILLCFRRTTTLGALIGIAVMANVVAMNFAFDVGVKLDSTFYLLALAYLAGPDATRLANVLVWNRPTVPRSEEPGKPSAWSHRLTTVLPAVLAAYVFARAASRSWQALHERGRLAALPPLYGLYDVHAVGRNGARRELSRADSTEWARVAIGRGRSTVRLASGTLGFYTAAVDTSKRTVRFTSRDDTTTVTWTYEQPDTSQLVLRGLRGGEAIELSLRRVDHTRYRLVSHPFHWAHDTNENR